MDGELRINELLEAISNNEKYRGNVFSGPGIYFVIKNDEVLEISDDAGYDPKGGWFPDILSGPTKEENACLEKLMEKFDFDECFFNNLVEDCGEFDDEYVLDYFEDNDDEESAKIYATCT